MSLSSLTENIWALSYCSQINLTLSVMPLCDCEENLVCSDRKSGSLCVGQIKDSYRARPGIAVSSRLSERQTLTWRCVLNPPTNGFQLQEKTSVLCWLSAREPWPFFVQHVQIKLNPLNKLYFQVLPLSHMVSTHTRFLHNEELMFMLACPRENHQFHWHLRSDSLILVKYKNSHKNKHSYR